MNWVEGIVTVLCCALVFCMYEDTLKAFTEIKLAQINADTFKDDKK